MTDTTTLRRERLRHGVTLREVAAAVGTAWSNLGRIEQGGGCDVALAIRLARYYDTTVEDLFGQEDTCSADGTSRDAATRGSVSASTLTTGTRA